MNSKPDNKMIILFITRTFVTIETGGDTSKNDNLSLFVFQTFN